jgi:DNA-binding response OmpR family regulator
MSEPSIETTPQILVVDDTPENLQIVGETLSRHILCDLSFATDGRQALESLKESLPDLILLDVMMPGLSGLDVCRTLKADPRTADIPVLFLTAKVESADVVAGFEAGGVDYIAKPFNPHELIARVKTQLEIRRTETERLRLEAQTRMLQKSNSLGCMAGAIAHKFNNQLQTVIGNLELADESLHEGTPAESFVTAALQASHNASELSVLMLTYLGQIPCKRQPLDFSELCRRTLPGLQIELPGSTQLVIGLPAAGPLVNANAQKLELMLKHLLTNAQESLGKQPGQIRLTLQTVPASAISPAHRFPPDWDPQDSTYACLEVADTGCGILPQDLETIFDPFFTTKFIGRGMGLPVVLGITRTHAGAVAVESEPNRGTVMRIFLPICSPGSPAPS